MKLGVIGCGKMGSALLGGILEAGLCEPGDVFVFDAFAESRDKAIAEYGVNGCESNREVVDQSEVVLLCVKPQGFVAMIEEIKGSSDRLLISIAAGVRLSTIEEATAGAHRIIRVMPNTPALVGRGASAYSLGSRASKKDGELAETLLGSVGFVCRVEEPGLDAVTALSGSGPAYVFLMIEALISGGEELGLAPDVSRELAIETVAGAAELLRKTGESPAQLRENVTSPNGTTFAALESFRSDNFEEIVRRAMKAAHRRSIELGGG